MTENPTAATTFAAPERGDAVARNEAGLVALRKVSVVFTTRKGLLRTGKVHALTDVSLEIPRGETVALVGESGSGKTTLGRVSLRLVKPTSGTVAFDGQEIQDVDDGDLDWFRRRAQIVFQD